MLSESNFLNNAKAIQNALNLKWDDYVESFGMTQKEAEKYLLHPQNFPLKLAMNFCERYGLDLENAFSEKFDAKVFARNYINEQPILPDHYQVEKNSRVQTLINFVSGLEDEGLEWLNDLIFRRLQVPKTILLYPELDIPFKLIIDYMDLFEKFSKDLEILKSSGQKGIINLDNKFHFAQQGTPLDVAYYDDFFSNKIQQFDKTYDYRVINHNEDKILLECILKEEFKDLYKLESISNDAFLEYKCGICDGLSTILGYSLGLTRIIKTQKNENEYFLIKMPKRPSFSQMH
jgi:hypothetical protein